MPYTRTDGLPGGYGSIGRFVKLAYIVENAQEPHSAADALEIAQLAIDNTMIAPGVALKFPKNNRSWGQPCGTMDGTKGSVPTCEWSIWQSFATLGGSEPVAYYLRAHGSNLFKFELQDLLDRIDTYQTMPLLGSDGELYGPIKRQTQAVNLNSLWSPSAATTSLMRLRGLRRNGPH